MKDKISALVFSAFAMSVLIQPAQADPSASTAPMGITQAQPHSYESLKNQLSMSLDELNAELQKSDTAALKTKIDAALTKMGKLKSSYYQSQSRNTALAFVTEFKKIRFHLKDLTLKVEPFMNKPFDVLEVMQEYESDTLVIDWKEVDAMTASWKEMINRYAEAETMVETIKNHVDQYVNEQLASGEFITLQLYSDADLYAVEKYLQGK